MRRDDLVVVERLEVCATTRRFRDTLSALAALRGRVSTSVVVDALGNGHEAHRSVLTTVCAFLRHAGSLSGAVTYAVSLGGDTSAIGAMAGALAGAHAGASTVPADWIAQVKLADELCDAADGLLELAIRED